MKKKGDYFFTIYFLIIIVFLVLIAGSFYFKFISNDLITAKPVGTVGLVVE